MSYGDKNITQLELYSYKFVGELSKEHLEYILIDLEVYKPWYVEDATLNKINEACEQSTKLRVYFSEKFRTLMIEPYKEAQER